MPAPRTPFLIVLLVAALTSSPCARAAETNEFLARIHTNAAGATLRYRLLLPKHHDPARAYPVVLFLHGAAARGDDNAAPLDWGPRLLLEEPARAHDFFLVIPQCPRGIGWTESGLPAATTRRKEPLGLALELVTEALPREFRLDPKRRYLTGVSMGGHAVWVALARYPGLFAAAVPVCAPGEPASVTPSAIRCPVWAFHSEDDHLVPVRQTRDMVKAWQGRGGIAKYTEYQGLRHSSWKRAYVEKGLFDWLFAQRLP